MSLPDFRPGQSSVSAEDMQELADSVRRFNDPLGGTGNNFFSSSIGDIQQQPSPDNWWIQITEKTIEGSGSGSGSGTGATRAAYGWVTVQRRGTDFIVMNDMPSGTLFRFPAYEQNGNREVPINTVVRAWVTSDQGLPCMEFVYCCDGGGGGGSGGGAPSDLCIQKILVSNCWDGTTLRQVFNITDGCKTIATSCEDVPNCSVCGSGSGSGSGTGGVSPCPCSFGSGPDHLGVQPFTPVTDASCNNCAFNKFLPICLFKVNDCMWWDQFGFVQNLCCQSTSIFNYVLQIHSDGSASLVISLIQFWGVCSPNWSDVVYYIPKWVCGATANVLNLIASNDLCGWPASVSIGTNLSNTVCGGGGGGTAGDCASCARTSWTLHMNGAAGCALVTNNACTGCPGIDSSSPYTLTETATGSCIFTSGITGVFLTCGGGGPTTTPAITFTLFDTGTGWELDIEQGGVVKMTYFLSYAAWNCAGGNVMPATVNYGGGCNWPNCVLVDA